MLNMKNTLKQSTCAIGLTTLFSLIASVVFSTGAAHAACAPPSDFGTTTQTVQVPSTGTYRIWSRVITPIAANNTYMLDIDGGSCYKVGGSALPINAWTWVDYQNGSPASTIDVMLSAGSHTFKTYGTSAGFGLDRIVLSADTACLPLSLGYNCAPPSDSTLQVSQTNNLIGGKTLTASVSAAAGFGIDNINDQNETTRWTSTPTDNAFVTADLGASYDLSKVSILWAGDTTKNYEIQTSTDNTTWRTAATAITNNTSPQLVNTTLSSTARYVRIHMLDRWNAGYGNSIWELGLYGTATTGTTTPPSTTVIGDVNGDNHVNTLDLSILLTHDGQNYAGADLNHDGSVGAADLAILLAHWTW
jgi:hypothetical protein